MTGTPGLLFDFLEWDSGFFSMRIGRIRGSTLPSSGVALLREQASSERMDCLYFLADPSSAETLNAAHALLMRPVDVRVDLSIRLPHGFPEQEGAGAARKPLDSEIEYLADLSGRLHDSTRFRSDPGFDRGMVTEMYRQWMRRSFSDPGCGSVVSGPPGGPEAYCTYSIKGTTGRIELLGVDVPARGRGTGAMLLRSALAGMAESGVETVDVATQGGSRASTGVYQSAGFRVVSIGLWLHYWPTQEERA